MLLLAVVALYVGPVKLARTILSLDPAWIALASLVYASLFLVKAAKWDALMRLDGVRVGYRTVLATIVAANASNLLLPAKLGDGVRGVVVRRDANVSFWYGMSSSILDRLLDFWATAAVAGLSLLAVPIPSLPAWTRTALEAAVAVAIVTGLGLLFSRRVFVWADQILLHRFHTTRRFLDDMVRPVDAFRRAWPTGLLLGVVACLVWLVEGTVAYWVALAAGAHVPFFLVVFGVQCANLTKAFPITPGGIGTYEAALGGILAWGGLGVDLAAAVAVVDHAIKNLVTLLASFPAASFLGIRVSRPAATPRLRESAADA